MCEKRISLAGAKAQLSELTEQAATGESIIITKRGKPVARLTGAQATRAPVRLAALRELTDRMPEQTEQAADFIQRMRNQSRY